MAELPQSSAVIQADLPIGLAIRHELKPGDIGFITYLHGVLYAREQGWDSTFEAYVAGPLAEFAKSGSPRQRIWIVEKEGVIVGTIAIAEHSEDEAQLRWLLVDPATRGNGFGKWLLREAISFCGRSDYLSIFLWTTAELVAAGKFYRSFGFEKTDQKMHTIWGAQVTEECYRLRLAYHHGQRSSGHGPSPVAV